MSYTSEQIRKIISGAQTGADQAGLVAGKILGLEVGGCVPKGRRTWTGPLTDQQMTEWNLVEHSRPEYPPRTKYNVQKSDGTVVFGNPNSPGCRLTIKLCMAYRKPCTINPTPEELLDWTKRNNIRVLNVAGNREEKNPGIFERTKNCLIQAFGKENNG